MNTVKILHTADIHIGAKEAHLESAAQSRRFETVFTFENIIKAAEENGVKLVLIAGDLFDSNRVESVFVERTLEAIKAACGLQFVLACGNHDPLSSDSPLLKYALPENLHILPAHDSLVELDAIGARVYGCSFDSVYKKGAPHFGITPPDDDIINIMCLHGEIKSDLSSDYNSITSEFLESCKMDYVALGHVHRRTAVQKIGSTYVAYCGCPEGHGFDESGVKGVYIGEASKNGCLLEFVPTARRQYIVTEVDITEADDIANTVLERLKAECGEAFRENLYKITLIGSIPEDARLDIAELSGRISAEVYFAKLRNKTVPAIDFKALAQETTLKGIFTKKCLERLEATESEAERERIKTALLAGIRAFSGEVKFDEA